MISQIEATRGHKMSSQISVRYHIRLANGFVYQFCYITHRNTNDIFSLFSLLVFFGYKIARKLLLMDFSSPN